MDQTLGKPGSYLAGIDRAGNVKPMTIGARLYRVEQQVSSRPFFRLCVISNTRYFILFSRMETFFHVYSHILQTFIDSDGIKYKFNRKIFFIDILKRDSFNLNRIRDTFVIRDCIYLNSEQFGKRRERSVETRIHSYYGRGFEWVRQRSDTFGFSSNKRYK